MVVSISVLWIMMILFIENNKFKVLALYSEIKVIDAEKALSRAFLFINNVTVITE